MSYIKQNWNPFDELSSQEENIRNHAVVTAEYLNHIENGIEEVSKEIEDISTQALPGKDGVDGKSAYELAVDGGYTGTQSEWLASLKGNPGNDGKDGAPGKDGSNGEKGDPGNDGQNGKSAYEIALENGFEGNQTTWLASLKGEKGNSGNDGANGKSAYELALEGGYNRTQTEWLESLKGEKGNPGSDGKSAYELAVDGGYTGTQSEWLASLKGNPGNDGKDGTNGEKGDPGNDGKSVYEIAVENGFEGDQTEWLASLRGEKGNDGNNGTDGQDGKSAYELAVDGGYTGTQSEWLASLKGEKGNDGQNGKSAYELAVDGGYTGTQSEWLASLKGEKGNDGQDGSDGQNGKSAYELAVDGGYTGTQSEWLTSLKGENGHNVGFSLVEPIDNEISKLQVSQNIKSGDYFISPNGSVYKMLAIKEGTQDIISVENTGNSVSGGLAIGNFKGEAIGHCSNLEVTVLNNGEKVPQLQIKYTDPENEGIPYGGTVVCVKEGSEPPSNPEDGIVIENIMDKNKHQTNPLVLDIERTDVLQRNFNVALFPYSSNGVFNLLKKEKTNIQVNWAQLYLTMAKSAKLAFTLDNGNIASMEGNSVVLSDNVLLFNYQYKFYKLDMSTEQSEYAYTEVGNVTVDNDFLNSVFGESISNYTDIIKCMGDKYTPKMCILNNRIFMLISILYNYSGAHMHVVLAEYSAEDSTVSFVKRLTNDIELNSDTMNRYHNIMKLSENELLITFGNVVCVFNINTNELVRKSLTNKICNLLYLDENYYIIDEADGSNNVYLVNYADNVLSVIPKEITINSGISDCANNLHQIGKYVIYKSSMYEKRVSLVVLNDSEIALSTHTYIEPDTVYYKFQQYSENEILFTNTAMPNSIIVEIN